jgi:hypothetical protein
LSAAFEVDFGFMSFSGEVDFRQVKVKRGGQEYPPHT